MTKIVKARVTGTFSNDVEIWLEEDEYEEMDEEDIKDALQDAWEYVEYEDLEVDESTIEVRDLPPLRRAAQKEA